MGAKADVQKPWSDPRDLALPHLRGARKLCEFLLKYVTMDGESPEKAMANADHHFLIGAMAYWEACMSFVVDQPTNAIQYLYPFSSPTATTYIHMFSGISMPLLITLARVGICVRQNKALRNMAAVGWKDGAAYQAFEHELLQSAIELAKWTVEHSPPADDTFDAKDLEASTCIQIKAFAQMCRFAILLELRRNFPTVFSTQVDDLHDSSAETGHQWQTTDLDRWCFDLSGAIIRHAREIPEGSTSGLYQTILLIICGSAIRSYRPPTPVVTQGLTLHARVEGHLLAALAQPEEIEKRRNFIRNRLQINCATFGLGQVYSRAEILLEEVWRELDAGANELDDRPLDRHWTDVMGEHKLETFFG